MFVLRCPAQFQLTPVSQPQSIFHGYDINQYIIQLIRYLIHPYEGSCMQQLATLVNKYTDNTQRQNNEKAISLKAICEILVINTLINKCKYSKI